MRAVGFRRVWLFGPVLLLAIGGCPLCPEPLYEITAGEPEVRLPLDEAPHCFGGAEWWYYSGRLRATGGSSFGVEAVVFHVPQFPFAHLADLWMAHYAVIDEQTGEFVYDQSLQLRPQFVRAPPSQGIRVSTPLVTAEGFEGRDQVQAMMNDGGFKLELGLRDTRDPILHGGNGYGPHGAEGMAFYYSRPRMDAAGTLVVDGEPLDVSGQLWFDRQWGLDIRDPQQQWDWFSIRLADGQDIMLFRFPGDHGPVAFGTLVPVAGEPRQLSGADFEVTPMATWTSPATGVGYDVTWKITVLTEELSLVVTAVADDQELDTRASTFNIYWEGLCDVQGLSEGKPVSGCAYVEQANGGF